MDENEVAQQKFNEAIDASIPIATKLMAIFNELAILVMPILEGLHWALDGIKSILSAIPDEVKSVIKGLVLFAGLVVGMTKFWSVLGGIAAGIGAIVSGITPIGWAIWGVVAAVGALWALWDTGPSRAKRLETSLHSLESTTASPGIREGKFKGAQQSDYGRTTRATQTMTQDKTSYATNTVNNNTSPTTVNVNGTFEVGGRKLDAAFKDVAQQQVTQ